MATPVAHASLVGCPARTRDGHLLGHVDGWLAPAHDSAAAYVTVAIPAVTRVIGRSVPVPLSAIRVENGVVIVDPVRHFAARAGTWRETDPALPRPPVPSPGARPAAHNVA